MSRSSAVISPVVDADQLSQRSDAPSERCAEFELIELTRPGRPEDVGDGGQHTLFGHHRVNLCLEPGPELHKLGSIADQLT